MFAGSFIFGFTSCLNYISVNFKFLYLFFILFVFLLLKFLLIALSSIILVPVVFVVYLICFIFLGCAIILFPSVSQAHVFSAPFVYFRNVSDYFSALVTYLVPKTNDFTFDSSIVGSFKPPFYIRERFELANFASAVPACHPYRVYYNGFLGVGYFPLYPGGTVNTVISSTSTTGFTFAWKFYRRKSFFSLPYSGETKFLVLDLHKCYSFTYDTYAWIYSHIGLSNLSPTLRENYETSLSFTLSLRNLYSIYNKLFRYSYSGIGGFPKHRRLKNPWGYKYLSYSLDYGDSFQYNGYAVTKDSDSYAKLYTYAPFLDLSYSKNFGFGASTSFETYWDYANFGKQHKLIWSPPPIYRTDVNKSRVEILERPVPDWKLATKEVRGADLDWAEDVAVGIGYMKDEFFEFLGFRVRHHLRNYFPYEQDSKNPAACSKFENLDYFWFLFYNTVLEFAGIVMDSFFLYPLEYCITPISVTFSILNIFDTIFIWPVLNIPLVDWLNFFTGNYFFFGAILVFWVVYYVIFMGLVWLVSCCIDRSLLCLLIILLHIYIYIYSIYK